MSESNAAAPPPRERDTRERKTSVGRLVLLGIGMFGFAFAMVPMYTLICKVTGLGGRTNAAAYVYDAARVHPDMSRTVRVNFLTHTNDGMPWDFEPLAGSVDVHPGMLTEVKFRVHNPPDRTIVGQAIPSLIPNSIVDEFHKTECFCFRRQTLAPGQSLIMPMRFLLDPAIARNVKDISLSYTMFDATKFAGSAANAVARVAPNGVQITAVGKRPATVLTSQ